MKPPEPRAVASDPGAGPIASNFDALAAALRRECETVRALRDALLEQRAGIAANRTDRVEDSVRSVGHLLLGLDEMRRHRGALLDRLAGEPQLALGQIESRLRSPVPAAFAEARRELRHAAAEVAREVAINHEVLQRSVEAGEAFLQALFSSVRGPDPSYHPGETRGGETPTGVIMNRRA